MAETTVREPAENEERWLGATWGSWGCAAVVGSLLIVALAIVTAIYGMYNTPRAFGPPEGLLRPDPELEQPFEPPPRRDQLVGIPPVGITEFTTGHELRLAEGVLFQVTRTGFDWTPPPPARPERELTYVEIRLRNDGTEVIDVASDHFRMETKWQWEQPAKPLADMQVKNRLDRRSVAPGETLSAALVFARSDLRQVRRFLVYTPPYREGEVRVMLIPASAP
jgi:hypothetical protein